MINLVISIFLIPSLFLYAQTEEEKLVQIFENNAPAVVFITTVRVELDPFDFFDPQPTRGIGSGFIFDSSQGLILTNAHVIVDPKTRIIVTLHGGDKIPAELVGMDNELDVAVVKLTALPSRKLTQVSFGNSDSLKVGRKVVAIGNPFGLDWTMTSGIISAVNRTVRTREGLVSMIQTDAAINVGSSGGPLFDLSGKVIGINTQILSKSGMFGGISFAVPIDDVKRILPDLLKFGKVRKPFIGWVLQNTQWGVAVRRVIPDSPADRAGIVPMERIIRFRGGFEFILEPEAADYILEFNGKKVTDSKELMVDIQKTPLNQPFSFLIRSGLNPKNVRRVFIKPLLR